VLIRDRAKERKMKARVEICGCPSIFVSIDDGRERGKDFEVSVFVAETGGASYQSDPAAKLRKELAGFFDKENLPEKVVSAAKESLLRGGYNQGPCRDFFDPQAAKYFSGVSGYERDEEKWTKLRRQMEDRLRKSNSIELLEVAINMGMKL
jgi:hypothetical protein